MFFFPKYIEKYVKLIWNKKRYGPGPIISFKWWLTRPWRLRRKKKAHNVRIAMMLGFNAQVYVGFIVKDISLYRSWIAATPMIVAYLYGDKMQFFQVSFILSPFWLGFPESCFINIGWPAILSLKLKRPKKNKEKKACMAPENLRCAFGVVVLV